MMTSETCNSPFVFCKSVRQHHLCDKQFLGDSYIGGIQKLRSVEEKYKRVVIKLV